MQSKRFTIIGNPVEHSVSPKMFEAAYAAHPELSYDRSPVTSAAEGVALLRASYSGGNVTAPFKEDVLGLVDKVSDDALAIGAANVVIVLADGRLIASNTDHMGVSGSLAHHGVPLAGARCVLLGIGGAGKAAAHALQGGGALLTIVNRTEGHAEAHARKLGCDWEPMDGLERLVRQADIVVNTLYPGIDIVDAAWLRAGQTVLDASYVGSVLLDKAGRRGCRCIDGRYWVYHQALPAFLDFTGIEPDQGAMRKLLDIE